ncbi:MAG: DMT family transporter [Legionella sp.]|nr:DMT family transporter [Legionella sp.]
MTQIFSKHIILPLLFVTLYGSGFVGAKLGLPYAEPLTFLVWRFALTTMLLIFIAIILGSPWPRQIKVVGHIMVAGLLMQATFSAGVFVAINLGISPAISALIIALQPILVALGAGFVLNEVVGLRQWVGLLLGLIGVAFVVSHNLTFSHAHIVGIMMAFIGLFGLTAGNLYQKRFCASMDIFTGGVIQSIAAFSAILILALLFESMHINWTSSFLFALLWMSVVVSIGAVSILYLLIRHREVNQVASIFYLVPVSTTILSFAIYNQTIGSLELLGMLITALGVILVTKK